MSRRSLLVLALAALALPAAAHAAAPPLLQTWTAAGPFSLGRPWDLAFDQAGHVYVADVAEHQVFVLTADGGFVTSWSCPTLPLLDFAPQGISIGGDGHVVVATPFPNGPPPFYVAAFTTDGTYLGPVGTMGSEPGQIGRAQDVAADETGTLYIADSANFRIDVLTAAGVPVTEWGSYGTGPGQFASPLSIALGPDGLVYTADGISQRVQVFTRTGTFVRQWGSYGSGPGQFAGPFGIALDAAGNVYVADASNHRIQVLAPDGRFLMQWGSLGSGPGQFYRPMGVGVGPDGRIYVADTWNTRIQVFGALATPASTESWGALKARYR